MLIGIRRGSFESVSELVRAIEDYNDEHNQSPVLVVSLNFKYLKGVIVKCFATPLSCDWNEEVWQ